MQNKIEYLRVILTNRCNFACNGCHKEGQEYSQEISYSKLRENIEACIEAGIKKVKFMGGEPTFYEKLPELIKYLRSKYAWIDISMISNGTGDISFYNSCFQSGLNRLNISVHGWEVDYFRKNTNTTFDVWLYTRNNIEHLLKEEKITKINYVLKKGINEQDLVKLVTFLEGKTARLDILNFLSMEGEKSSLFYSMEQIKQFLDEHIGVVGENEYINKYSINSQNIVLKNGVNVNLKVNSLKNENYLLKCKTCHIKEKCIEGIKAVRLTAEGNIQPCLLRNDNLLLLKEDSNNLVNVIEEYFVNL